MVQAESINILADCSLSLINRTGAHYIVQELTHSLGHHFSYIRRWRLLSERLPEGLVRKILGRMMLKELGLLRDSSILQWPEPRVDSMRRLFMDPLYVLRSELTTADIVLCHDIGPLTHQSLFSPSVSKLYELAYGKIQKAKPGIVFVSATTSKAFVELFGTDYRFLQTIPLYVRSSSAVGEARKPLGIEGKYILTVGALERRKNQVNAIRAYHATGLAREGIGYLLCGSRGEGSSEILEEANRTPGVKVLGYIDDAELRWLYRNALAFLLPSLLEGFGMPALEVASFGVIPIVSANSALEEAVGGLGISVDPISVSDIAKGIESACEMPTADRKACSEALIKHAASYSPDRFLSAWDALLLAEKAAQ